MQKQVIHFRSFKSFCSGSGSGFNFAGTGCQLLSDHEIAPRMWKIFPLSEVVQAHELLEQGKVRRKIVLKIDE
jgi:NADPH:quinone reductase-like Zn-dependent oxidoreductase